MKRPGYHNNQQLLQMLGKVLRKETEGWTPRSYKKVAACSEVEIGGEQRDATIVMMAALNAKFDFYPETYFLAVAILDQFLAIVKARPKHLKCIGVAAFYLAAKTVEEDEVIPATLELVRESRCGCSQAEILRMERCILGKLDWDLRFVTPLDFLHIFHALLYVNVPHLLDACGHMTPARQLSLVTTKLERSVASHTTMGHAPSILALSVLSLELELFCPNWLSIIFTMQKMVNIDNDELIQCREVTAACIATMGRGSGGKYVYASKSPSPPANTTPTKRRRVNTLNTQDPEPTVTGVVEEEEEENIYEGIKRLYDEEENVASVSMATCGSEARREAIATSPLQAVAN